MKLKSIIDQVNSYVMNTYKRKPEGFVSAKGSWLKSITGRKVLDFFPGWGVSNIGHCHPLVVKAVSSQVKKIIHMANVFYIPEQGVLAKLLVENSFKGKVFFCNSGAESIECAIKSARAWGRAKGKSELVSFYHSFHGRTIGALTLTAQSHYQEPFAPLMPDVKYAEFNDIDSVKRVVTDRTCAIVLELVQGEGGVRVADMEFVLGLAKLAKGKDFLLIFDEVQTGFGRTGKMFAFQNYGVKPDELCLSKSIANGIPMGACVIADPISSVLKPGMHASTFGGNYIACAAAIAVLEAFKKEKILEHMIPVQEKLVKFFSSLASKYQQVKSFRYLGTMFGIEMYDDYAAKISDQAPEQGLIINCTAGNVLRIMPALNLSMKDCDAGIKIIEKVFNNVCK